MLVERRFDTGEVELNYAEGPNNGPAIIFLHGVLSNWQYYQPIITNLQSRWHIYAIDHRGHGKSEHTPNQYGLEYYYKDHQQFIDKKNKRTSNTSGTFPWRGNDLYAFIQKPRQSKSSNPVRPSPVLQ